MEPKDYEWQYHSMGRAIDIKTVPIRQQILNEAASLIVGDREQDYGAPEDNFQRIADIWNVLFPEVEFTPAKVALAMLALKLARTPQGYKHDTAVDAAGYAALYAELSEKGL